MNPADVIILSVAVAAVVAGVIAACTLRAVEKTLDLFRDEVRNQAHLTALQHSLPQQRKPRPPADEDFDSPAAQG